MKDTFFDNEQLHLINHAQSGNVIGEISNERISCDETTTPAFNTCCTFPLKQAGEKFNTKGSLVFDISAISGSGGTYIRGVNALALFLFKRFELQQDSKIKATTYPDNIYHNLKYYKNSDEYSCISQPLAINTSGNRATLAGSAQTLVIPLSLLFSLFCKPLQRSMLKGNLEIKAYLRDNLRYVIQTDKTAAVLSITDAYLDLEYVEPSKSVIEASNKMYIERGFISQPYFNVEHIIVEKSMSSGLTSYVANLPEVSKKRIIDIEFFMRASALKDTNDVSDYTDTFIAPTSWNLKSSGKYLNGLQKDVTKTYYDKVIVPRLELSGQINLLSGTGVENTSLISFANDHKTEKTEYKRYHGGRWFEENDVQLTVNFSSLAAQTDLVIIIREAKRFVIKDGVITNL